MKSIGKLKWKYKPSGLCPVQAEGWFFDWYFYFRSRNSTATIEFSKTEEDWLIDNCIKYELYKTKNKYKAGHISEKFALFLIYIGFVKFLFYLLKKKYESF